MKRKSVIFNILLLASLFAGLLAACSSGSAADQSTASTSIPAAVPTEEPAVSQTEAVSTDTPAASQTEPVATEEAALPETGAEAGQAVEFTKINLNTATADDFLTVPEVGDRMVREFMEYRPYVSIEQFRREIGKYVSQDQVAAYEQYVYIPISVNEADAATLMQIPGLEADEAQALIAARPFANNEAFLTALSPYLAAKELAGAGNYLES